MRSANIENVEGDGGGRRRSTAVCQPIRRGVHGAAAVRPRLEECEDAATSESPVHRFEACHTVSYVIR